MLSANMNNLQSMIPQDLHIHTVYSKGDPVVVKEQTIDLIKQVHHARIIGISDHFEYLTDEATFSIYEKEIRSAGFRLGIEISGYALVQDAVSTNCDYFVYHCSQARDYAALDHLLSTGKPVIIAHPLIMGTDLSRIPRECFVEVNNRYIWKSNWREDLRKFIDYFNFVISSDAHQPNWLNQNVARYVCLELGIRETIIFADNLEKIPPRRERKKG